MSPTAIPSCHRQADPAVGDRSALPASRLDRAQELLTSSCNPLRQTPAVIRFDDRLLRALVAVLLCCVVPSAAASGVENEARGNTTWGRGGTEEAADALMTCFNAKFSPEPIQVDMYLRSIISRSLRIHRIWWSKRQHQLPVTLFTHSDLGRLKSVAAQCRGYPGGVISVAVWVPLISSNTTSTAAAGTPQGDGGGGGGGGLLESAHAAALRNATDLVDQLFAATEAEAEAATAAANGTATPPGSGTGPPSQPCVLRVLLLSELVADDIMAALMPLNILRNAALLAATTPLVAMVDADMATNWGLANQVLRNATRVAEMERAAAQDRVAWVLPIFDTNDKLPLAERMALTEAAVAAGPNPKAQLLEMWRSQARVFPYGSKTFAPGHSPTDCERWSGTSSTYQVLYVDGYEPFYLGDRKAIPPYDSRFRGYYRDKIVNTAYVSSLGFQFWVLPDVWMVHRPHHPSMASYKWHWFHDPKTQPTPLEKVVQLLNGTRVRARNANSHHSISTFRAALGAMGDGSYRLQLNAATQHCRSELPWWR